MENGVIDFQMLYLCERYKKPELDDETRKNINSYFGNAKLDLSLDNVCDDVSDEKLDRARKNLKERAKIIAFSGDPAELGEREKGFRRFMSDYRLAKKPERRFLGKKLSAKLSDKEEEYFKHLKEIMSFVREGTYLEDAIESLFAVEDKVDEQNPLNYQNAELVLVGSRVNFLINQAAQYVADLQQSDDYHDEFQSGFNGETRAFQRFEHMIDKAIATANQAEVGLADEHYNIINDALSGLCRRIKNNKEVGDRYKADAFREANNMRVRLGIPLEEKQDDENAIEADDVVYTYTNNG